MRYIRSQTAHPVLFAKKRGPQMVSKRKPNGCTACREVEDAARTKRQSLAEFFSHAALCADIPAARPLGDLGAGEAARMEAVAFIRAQVQEFESFCADRTGNYEIPQWVTKHVERTNQNRPAVVRRHPGDRIPERGHRRSPTFARW